MVSPESGGWRGLAGVIVCANADFSTKLTAEFVLATLQALFVLFESASGFGLFEVKELDEIGNSAEKVQQSVR